VNGFSPVWILECAFRVAEFVKDIGQRLQLNGFSPVWILVCALRDLGRAKDFGQREQPNCFVSCVWTLEWFLSCDESLKDFSHEEQLNGFSSVW